MLSGNRNFEGRVNQDVRANYLASPPLVVAYAIAGTMNFDFAKMPLGIDKAGKKVFLKDIWPTGKDIAALIKKTITKQMFARKYAHVFKGDAAWSRIAVKGGLTYGWERKSTYVQNPPYFADMARAPGADHRYRRCPHPRPVPGFDHHRPHLAGRLDQARFAGRQISVEHKVKPADFNQYGTRRGNHEVMMRGTFANIRIKNQMLSRASRAASPSTIPRGDRLPIYDAAMRYKKENVPLVVFAGKEYGTGSSRDWAAKGTILLGIRAVICQSLRAHPPLQPDRHGRDAPRLRGRHVVADARPQGQRAGDDPRPARRPQAAPADDRRDRRRPTARSNGCRYCAASIRSTSSNISRTAASCNTCCGTSRRDSQQRGAARTCGVTARGCSAWLRR